jgi:hypothetical protein
MGDASDDPMDELTADERAAIEEIEGVLESFHRAHGALVEFHHMVGRGMDHFDEAEGRLRSEHDDLADELREEVLPAGVTDDGKLTYELVAEFEEGMLTEVESIVESALDDLADGQRYSIEREEFGRAEDSE